MNSNVLGKDRQVRSNIPSTGLDGCTPQLAEKEGFEPPRPEGLTVFKTAAISQTLPLLRIWCRTVESNHAMPEGPDLQSGSAPY